MALKIEQLINQIKKHTERSATRLSRLYKWPKEDLLQQGYLAILENAAKLDSEKINNVEHYFRNLAKYNMLSYVIKHTRHWRYSNLLRSKSVSGNSISPEDMAIMEELKRNIDKVTKNSKENKIAQLVLKNDYTPQEAGEIIKCSAKEVSEMKTKIINRIKTKCRHTKKRRRIKTK